MLAGEGYVRLRAGVFLPSGRVRVLHSLEIRVAGKYEHFLRCRPVYSALDAGRVCSRDVGRAFFSSLA